MIDLYEQKLAVLYIHALLFFEMSAIPCRLMNIAVTGRREVV